jgi:HPt (histidine-containing phosphotransfer) domain-containing protein
MFREDTPTLLAELGGLVSGRDAGALHRAAHSLCGGLATVGATAAAEAAGRIEMMARAGDLGGLEEAWAALRHEIDLLERELSMLEREPDAA